MAGGRLLEFKDYVGGADNVQVIEMFPKSQKTFTYDFDRDVSGYTFTSDLQTILLDSVTYDRTTGDPNFSTTNVTGYFSNLGNVVGAFNTAAASTGTVEFTIPQNRYTGWILPNARANVVMTVVSVEWLTDDTPTPSADLHRWAIIERWEPGVTPGDPADANNTVTFNILS